MALLKDRGEIPPGEITLPEMRLCSPRVGFGLKRGAPIKPDICIVGILPENQPMDKGISFSYSAELFDSSQEGESRETSSFIDGVTAADARAFVKDEFFENYSKEGVIPGSDPTRAYEREVWFVFKEPRKRIGPNKLKDEAPTDLRLSVRLFYGRAFHTKVVVGTWDLPTIPVVNQGGKFKGNPSGLGTWTTDEVSKSLWKRHDQFKELNNRLQQV